MGKIIINGGRRLQGEVDVGGAKNAALAVLPAALLSDGVCTIENVPIISDVLMMCEIFTALGADVAIAGNTVRIDPSGLRNEMPPEELCRQFRASYYMMGVMLGRFKQGVVPMPGGCAIGARPVDQHLKGFDALGAKVHLEHGHFRLHAEQLIGNEIYLDVVTVGATVNIMLAAARARGTTVIVNAAKEPHIVDLANFLNSMGALVRGAGTNVIRVRGVESLHASNYMIIPDQIETGTLMAAAAGTQGNVLIRNIIPIHMEAACAKLMELGCEVFNYEDSIRVIGPERLRAANLKTLPYPGFPTDLQSPFAALLAVADGISVVTETIYESRFRYADEMCAMGANVRVLSERTAMIQGVDRLHGAYVQAPDLRAGAALIIAGLMAEGTTEIADVLYIDRGYEQIDRKLCKLGADIRRI